MAKQIYGDLDLTRELQLNGAPGTAGQALFSAGDDALPTWGGLVSADANNAIAAGADAKAFLDNTTVSLGYNAGTTVLSFVDLAGNTTNIDLSALAADIFVNGGSFDGATSILTLTDNDGGTPDVTVDLSTLEGSFTGPVAGVYTYDSGNGTTFAIDVKDGVSADANQDLTVGTDGLPFFEETVTTLTGMTVALPNQLSYANEAGGPAALITLVSTDAGNDLAAGTDGKLFVDSATKSEQTFVVADWGAAVAGIFTLTLAAGGFTGASSSAMYQVFEGAAAPFESAFGLHSSTLNADGSVTLQSTVAFDGKAVYIS